MGIFGKRQPVEWAESELLKIIQDHKEQMYRLAYAYVKNEQDALDIVQEAVCKAVAGVGAVREPRYLKTWLFRILINGAIDAQRKCRRIIPMDELPLEGAAAENQADTAALLDLRNALEELDAHRQTLIRLRFFEDLTLEEIARTMELPVGTVKTQLHRTLRQLRVELKEVEADE